MNGTLFALQITDNDLKLLCFRRENGSSVAVPMAHVPAGEGADPREALSFLMEEVPEDRPQALLILNSGDQEFRDFSYPFETERKVRNAIDFELTTDFPAEEYIHDHIKALGREPGYHTFIASLIRRSTLEERIRVMEDAGFRVVGITSDVSTLGAAFREEEEALVMDTGEHHTLFALFRLGVPVLLRKIPIGCSDLAKDGSKASNGLVQLAAEIKRTLHSFNNRVGLELDRLYVTGNLLYHENASSALQEHVRTAIVLRSADDYAASVEEGSDSPDINVFAPLIGSIHWKRRNGFFNFLAAGLAREEDAALSSRRVFRWGAGFAGIFLLLLLLSYSLDILALQARQDALKAAMRSTFTQAFPQVTRIVDELKQARNLLEAERAATAGGNPLGGVPLLTALRSISAAIPEGVPFQIVSLFWETGKIEIYARTDAFKTVNDIQELLAGSNDIAQAAISNARLREEGRDVEFKLSIRLAG